MTEPRPNSCNQHIDCDAADARQLERFKAWEVEESQKAARFGIDHCYRSPIPVLADHCYEKHGPKNECEDCFGD